MKSVIGAGAACAAMALAGAASADVTIDFVDATFAGFSFDQLFGADAGEYLVGTLTGVSVNAVLTASTSFTYADDLCLYVDPLPLATGGLLQVGGFSNLNAAERIFWANGASSAPGTTVIDTVTLGTPLVFTGSASDAAVWLGNGYGGSGTSGTWTGSMTLIGVEAIPAPGAVALLGLAGLAGTRRRRG
jgi:MYXO-CTERM domain-containing protein